MENFSNFMDDLGQGFLDGLKESIGVAAKANNDYFAGTPGETYADIEAETRAQSRQVFLTRELNVTLTIRLQRMQAGLSQAELAERLTDLGMPFSQAQIAKLEKGNRPLRMAELFAIGQALSVPANVFLSDGVQIGTYEPSDMDYLQSRLESFESVANSELERFLTRLETFGRDYAAKTAAAALVATPIQEISARVVREGQSDNGGTSSKSAKISTTKSTKISTPTNKAHETQS
jgi:transcriptional regulator with XRE-family HTH domain